MWWVLALLSVAIAGYAGAYVIVGERLYPAPLAESFIARPWGILPHSFIGMFALALGPLQFHPAVQARAGAHRLIGWIYVVTAGVVGIAGLYMAIYAFGGLSSQIGFAGMAIAVLFATATALTHVLRGAYRQHREWMIRSFAVLFSAVTLRLWLPLLIAVLGGFEPAYRVVAWLSWVLNLAVAEGYIRWSRRGAVLFGGAQLPVARRVPDRQPIEA